MLIIHKKRSISSYRWLRMHVNDKYVQKAHKMGLRSRAWFKLQEIHKGDKIFKPGMTVVDLGAAPGGWSQYAITQVGNTGKIIACDLLSMEPIFGVDFLQGDLTKKSVLKTLLTHVNNNKVLVVMSDMAPNMCGIPEIDTLYAMRLAKQALCICKQILAPGGKFVVKVFQGEHFGEYLKEISLLFTKIKIRKPNSSRLRSREIYIVATGYKS